MNIKKLLFIVGLFVFSFFVGFKVSYNIWSERFSEDVLIVQARKVKNNLIDLQEIHSLIIKNCFVGAEEMLANNIDHHLMYLSEYIDSFPAGELAEEITNHDPELLEIIKSKKVNWSKTYTVKGCD